MSRRRSAAVAFVVAVAASLGVHLPVWGVLGHLAKILQMAGPAPIATAEAAVPSEPHFMELPPLEVPEESEEEVPVEVAEADVEVEEERERARPTDETPRRTRPRPRPPTPEEVAPEPQPEPELVPPPEVEPNRQAAAPLPVEQQSQDPTVAPPDNARYLAAENNRVEEETVAEVTNMVEDHQEQLSPGEAIEESEAENLGNADDNLVRETRDEEGADDQLPAQELVQDEQAPSATDVVETGATPAPEEAVTAQEGGAAEPEMETVTVSDGFGTFVIRRPVSRGAGDGGRGEGPRRAGHDGQRGSGAGGDAQREGPNLQIGWRQFEGIFGEEQLRQEREDYAAAVLSRQRGNGRREREWREFRAAIENFVSGVRPGNQTALNARASPFAAYLAALHRRIHVTFHGFVDALPNDPSHPMGDPSLVTRLELVFQPDGSIARIGVVRSSGVLVYDFAAYTAIRRATPFPAPPEAIRSGDGKTYLHWDLMRSPPFCRTDNARPFILDNAPAESAGDDGGAQLGGSSVPEGAQPTWGTVRERGPVRSAEDTADPERESAGESSSDEENPPPEDGGEEAEEISETAPEERTPD